MGHRRFLPMDHRWRKEARSFDGTQELDHPPPMPTGDEIWRQVQGIDSVIEAIRKRPNIVQVDYGCFTMTKKEKKDFLKVIQNVKVPDGYASNISRCAKVEECSLVGLKSHDSHILMQHLMPIALRGSLTKKVVEPLIALSGFFREICSKTLRLEDLDRLESRIPYILCQLERIFPPGFFTVMVHLLVHLATECKLGGPDHYRWMCLRSYKGYIRNKAAPEGSIAEGYVAEELLTFCSRYLESSQTVFNRPHRNPEDARGEVKSVSLDEKLWVQAHRYILFNSDDFIPFRTMHKEELRTRNRRDRRPANELDKLHRDQFCDWFRGFVENMDDSRRNELDDKIKSHSIGPVKLALKFKRYVTNGMMFRIRDSENGKSTQNSGVCVSTEDDTPYYGQLTHIIEVQYYDGSRYVLFKCDWANIALGRGYKNDEYGFILVNFSRLIHTGKRITDDPFVLASQVSQVYYVADERIPN
ncbi:uncharacterized protein LOC133871559 [Alnus glutinosa]|uniref:uncharacterized protein LOC133871559 n=1 Tax=Alnus glutinosa TaxID=3517 RepID=UPI002D771E94|nr:uncharacterized protein LOC133871559 [Alnus glutinosa]